MPEVFVPRNIKCPIPPSNAATACQSVLLLPRSSSPSNGSFRRHRTFANGRAAVCRISPLNMPMAEQERIPVSAGTGNALDAVEMVPRYGRVITPPPADTTLFGKTYAAPIGIAPVGGPGTSYPGAETYLARAAQAANVPYTLGLLSGIDIERAAEIAPDVLWLQLYRFSRTTIKSVSTSCVERRTPASTC